MISPSATTSNPMVRFAVKSLPSRMKRIVVLASLTAIAKKTKVPERALIKKLNQVLQLSTEDAALKLPIHVSRLIWTNTTVFDEDLQRLTQCNGHEEVAQQAAHKVAELLPDWLRYAPVALVVKDIMDLFADDSCIFPAAGTQALPAH